jgi:hypothetical protein
MKRLAITTLLMLGISGCITPVSYHIPQTTPKGQVSAGAAITYWGSTIGVSPLPSLAPFIRYGLSENLDFGIGFEGIPVLGLSTIDIKYQFLQGGINGSLRLGVGAQLAGFVPYASLSFGTNTVYGGLGVQYWNIDAGLFKMTTLTPQGFFGLMLGSGSVKFVPELNVMVPIASIEVFGKEATGGVLLFKVGFGVAYIPSK